MFRANRIEHDLRAIRRPGGPPIIAGLRRQTLPVRAIRAHHEDFPVPVAVRFEHDGTGACPVITSRQNVRIETSGKKIR